MWYSCNGSNDASFMLRESSLPRYVARTLRARYNCGLRGFTVRYYVPWCVVDDAAAARRRRFATLRHATASLASWTGWVPNTVLPLSPPPLPSCLRYPLPVSPGVVLSLFDAAAMHCLSALTSPCSGGNIERRAGGQCCARWRHPATTDET